MDPLAINVHGITVLNAFFKGRLKGNKRNCKYCIITFNSVAQEIVLPKVACVPVSCKCCLLILPKALSAL